MTPKFSAHWLTRDLLALDPHSVPPGDLDWYLEITRPANADPEGSPGPVTSVRLTPRPGLPGELGQKHPHLRNFLALKIAEELGETAIQGGVRICGYHGDELRVRTLVGLAEMLDEVYASAAHDSYGLSWQNGSPSLKLWAPTASNVELLLWQGAEPARRPMRRNSNGAWEITGDPSWNNARYRYAVTVYMPCQDRVVTNEVTDPYSVALTPNSTHSLFVDLNDPDLAPSIWRETTAPKLPNPCDQVIYELHVRDFSVADKTIPAQLRGTYLAFAQPGHGAKHLRRLAQAGLTTVQLLPIADFATVEENRHRHVPLPKDRLKALPPDSPEQQEIIAAQPKAFNWGYDPWHFQVPEGSFAVKPDGRSRIAECRTMIGAVHEMGLRVVLDQVFNHTSASGLDDASVFDRIVPGYYHRLDDDGRLACSTCCPNVATERLMAEKLMVDSVVLWAKQYRVDGFRFDLMGHHSRANLLAVRAALDALTLENDGVDGRAVTLHGEGWNFGEVANDARFVQARQGNLGGTGISTFSDRLRDSVRGGSPFDVDPRAQGFGTGLMLADNGAAINGSGFDQRARLFHYQDLIQLGLAGNLRDYVFESQSLGRRVRGADLDYHGQAAGYADEPGEIINYVDVHDNETLFDALTMKLHVLTTMSERVRMNTLCLAFATLGQSPVLWHAGSDFLRSKSCDRNSYDSSDWFNFLDFSMKDNGFRAGLPPAKDNFESWPHIRPLLAMPKLKPSSREMRQAAQAARELLMLRGSSPLFRLGSAALIQQKVKFPTSNTWVNVPGVIVMLIDDTVGEPVDDVNSGLLVVFNGTPRAVHQRVPMLKGRAFELSPIQQEGNDPLVARSAFFGPEGVLTVPARCVAVFVEPRAAR